MGKCNRGGARPGAGAKRHGEKVKVKVCLSLDADVLEFVQGAASDCGSNRSGLINSIIADHYGLS